MDFILQDLEKYKRAKVRAEALKWIPYLEPLGNIIHELERLDRIDENVREGRVTLPCCIEMHPPP